MDNFFYSTQIENEKILLSKDEAFHAIKVLRKQKGDLLYVVDGKGNLYNALVEKDDISDCQLSIENIIKEFGKQNYYIHIAIAPTKSHDRIENFVEKAVELGVQEISFVKTDFSERNNIKLNRINKCSLSAMKQSLKAYSAKINDMVAFSEFIKGKQNSEKFIADIDQGINNHLFYKASKYTDYCVIIGPEGGFSNDELLQSVEYKYKPINLSDFRLRTETAGIAACQILNLRNK